MNLRGSRRAETIGISAGCSVDGKEPPEHYESAALPTELHQLMNFFVNLFIAALSNNQRPADYEVYPGAEPAAVQWLAAKVKATP